jgi:hypothetical protein
MLATTRTRRPNCRDWAQPRRPEPTIACLECASAYAVALFACGALTCGTCGAVIDPRALPAQPPPEPPAAPPAAPPEDDEPSGYRPDVVRLGRAQRSVRADKAELAEWQRECLAPPMSRALPML